MSGDVLVKWDWEITAAEAASSYGGGDASAMCIRDLAAALRAEQARVAEMEPDAKLARMVREMPEGAILQRIVSPAATPWSYVEPRPAWGTHSHFAHYGVIAEEAISAVRGKP